MIEQTIDTLTAAIRELTLAINASRTAAPANTTHVVEANEETPAQVDESAVKAAAEKAKADAAAAKAEADKAAADKAKTEAAAKAKADKDAADAKAKADAAAKTTQAPAIGAQIKAEAQKLIDSKNLPGLKGVLNQFGCANISAAIALPAEKAQAFLSALQDLNAVA